MTRRRAGAVLASLVLVTTAATACSGGDPAIFADPMVSTSIAGTTGPGAVTRQKGTTLFASSQPKVTRTLPLGQGASPDAVLGTAVGVAESHGWQVEARSAASAVGTKGDERLALDVGGTPASLFIVITSP